MRQCIVPAAAWLPLAAFSSSAHRAGVVIRVPRELNHLPPSLGTGVMGRDLACCPVLDSLAASHMFIRVAVEVCPDLSDQPLQACACPQCLPMKRVAARCIVDMLRWRGQSLYQTLHPTEM